MAQTAATVGPDVDALVDWLERIIARRDLAATAPHDPRAPIIEALLDAVSREFADYREVVAGARNAAHRNAEALATVVRSASEQGSLIGSTADATNHARDGSGTMSDASVALRGYTQAAADAVIEAGTNLAVIDTALTELAGRLAQATRPLDDMRRSTVGVGNFLGTLARLSRHAQLLAVNASIEAAHLAEGGSRFAIVAQEVRKLSTSTRESRADVATIVSELRAASDQVAGATRESTPATCGAAAEITGAGAALEQTGSGIEQFEKLGADIAEIAGTQRTALDSISGSIDQIARHAQEAATASHDAARLDLDTLVERARSTAGRWTLRQPAQPALLPSGDPFTDWIVAVIAGHDSATATDLDRSDELRPLVTAIRALLTQVASEHRAVLAAIVEVAVAASRNGYAWRSIHDTRTGIGHEIEAVCEMIGESARGARTAAELAAGMGSVVGTIRSQCDSALTLLEGALARIVHISGSVEQIDGFVKAMSDAAARADQIMALIETLSSETDLLSLNAAIEAAHAGELGLGFSVIAEEIRALARSTNASTVSVSELVATIRRISADLQQSIGAAATGMSDVVGSADGVRAAIATLRSSFEAAAQRALAVSATAAEQSAALDRVLATIDRSQTAAATDGDTAARSDRARLELAMLGTNAHAIAARRPIGTVIERVRAFAEKLSAALEASFAESLAAQRMGPDRLFDLRYTPIAGEDIASLGRLFDVSRVPPSGFTPAKYATPWDAYVDVGLNRVLEAAYDEAAAFKLVTIFISDLNGFFYAYPQRKIAAWTNDPATDNLGNRIKRLFEDEYALRIGRWGLGPNSEGLGARVSYDQFQRSGCELQRRAERPWAGSVYARDTNAVCNEVIMALYIGDMRHSTLRICYDPTLI